MQIVSNLLIVLIVISSLILIASILLQPGKSAGLSGSIGGGSENSLGKKRSRGFEGILEKATTISAILFMLSAFLYSII